MEQNDQHDVIQKEFVINVLPDKAFELFVHELNNWWPKEYTWSQDTLETIAIEPRAKGRCFERGPHGFECDWGRVIRYEPGRRILFTWQIGVNREPVPDPDKASEIEVTFHPEGDAACRVDFQHRRFSRHGEGAGNYLKALDSPQGWEYILGSYKEMTKTVSV